jgi:hypothetical protein
MLHVQVPIDVGTAITSQNPVFALVTPMRVRELLELAVTQALGKRAPADKRERNLAQTVAGLASRRFAVDIDGKLYDDPEACVACSGTVTLRFFSVSHQPVRES